MQSKRKTNFTSQSRNEPLKLTDIRKNGLRKKLSKNSTIFILLSHVNLFVSIFFLFVVNKSDVIQMCFCYYNGEYSGKFFPVKFRYPTKNNVL